MAQISTDIPVLLLLVAFFNPIVCPSSKINSDRRDRAPYIETSDLGPQYLSDTIGRGSSRSRITQFPLPPPRHSQQFHQSEENEGKRGLSIQTSISPPPLSHSQSIEDIEDKIGRVFETKFGPGLHLFNNTEPTDRLKVQRSPTGKLDVVYRKDFLPPKNDETSQGNVNDGQRQNREPSGGQMRENGSMTSATNKQSPIIFPTEDPEKDEINYTVNSDDCVEKDGEHRDKPFCTNLRNYPERTYLEKVIKKKFSNLEIFFGEDLVIPQNISQRMNSEPNEEYLCKTRTRVIYPQAGQNKDYNWLIIINIPNYKQGIRIEECINEGSVCGESNGLMLPNRYTATCKQSYIYRSLVAFTNETVIRDQFKMPSCCKCVLRPV
ncbi:spaetzle domain-containing protein isoform X2 [Haematobia irritans]|uniref:spaetzle domain-containing protein isoform X2 n=1 Tax=Haematobia irritans TaxID=7368 RepID=UPI003F505D5B